MNIGTTYSQSHIRFLHLNEDESFQELLKFQFECIRIPTYWNLVETNPTVYTYTRIHKLLRLCERNNQKVVVTLGMKSPRWPEFYIPEWCANVSEQSKSLALRTYMQRTIEELAPYACIVAWQVENEPLDPSGPQHTQIASQDLIDEISLVRSLDTTRKVVVTFWGNEMIERNRISQVSEYIDTIGLDLYYRVPKTRTTYSGPTHTSKEMSAALRKPLWITELQAEPWEKNEVFSSSVRTPSLDTDILLQNYKKALQFNAERIFLWGYEYWYWKKIHGDSSLWQTVRSIIGGHVQ